MSILSNLRRSAGWGWTGQTEHPGGRAVGFLCRGSVRRLWTVACDFLHRGVVNFLRGGPVKRLWAVISDFLCRGAGILRRGFAVLLHGVRAFLCEAVEMLRDMAALLFPPHCPVCGEPLARGERTVCTLCRATAPLTGFQREADNLVVRKFWGQLPVVHASGFLYFNHHSGWRNLIHGFKYRGAWRTAREMGTWYGNALRESDLYGDVEVIIPLPLHPLKRCKRGYNQSDYIAEGIASQLGVGIDCRSVRRKRNTASQALKPRRERAKNVEEAFAVRRPERLEGRHILLVDDVLTTGSTLMACASEILRAAPTCRISIAVLAVSRHELGVKE